MFHYFWVAFALLLIFSTYALWMGTGEYPRVPFTGLLVNVGNGFDRIVLGSACVALFLMLVIGDESRVWPVCCGTFVAGMIGLFLLDQHRFQPWAWQFALIGISAILFPARIVAFWWRLLAISIYLFSAISKFDVSFADELGQMFLKTSAGFVGVDVTEWSLVVRRVGAFSFPIWEFSTGLFLCFRGTRFLGMWMAWVMHGMLLAILGPWGLNHQAGVLLWNGFFICQAGLLFWPCMYQGPTCPLRVPGERTTPGLRGGMRGIGYTVVLLMPLLEPVGWYDHWPSWGLYASHVERVHLFVHREARSQLPAAVQTHLTESNEGEWLRLKLDRWSLTAQRAPIYPQGRFQLGVCAAVIEKYGLRGKFLIQEEGPAGRFSGVRHRSEIGTWTDLERRLGSFLLNAQPRR